MSSLKNISCIFCLTFAFISTSCSDAPISEKTMQNIFMDMYLLDSASEFCEPEIIHATDTSLIYEAVFKKYGYTIDDYNNALEYYIHKPDKLVKICEAVEKILKERLEVMEAAFRKEQKLKETWIVAEQAAGLTDSVLRARPYYRAIKWIVNPLDSVYDYKYETEKIVHYNHPLYPDWWKDNLNQDRSFRFHEGLL